MTNVDQQYAATAALLLRIGLGTMWIAHALLKWLVFTLPGFASWLSTMGLAGFMAWPVFLMEITGGVMILLGFYGRYVSGSLIPIMLVAAWTHYPNGWLHTNEGGGWEYPLFLVLASIVHMLLGDGKLALTTSPKLIPR